MRWSAAMVTGSMLLTAASAGVAPRVADAGRFEDALGPLGAGTVVEDVKDETSASVDAPHDYLATDTRDAMVAGAEIDARLLAEGLIHSTIEGPIGPEDPSVTGQIRPRARAAVNRASSASGASAAQATPLHEASHQPPSQIADRVAEAEPIESAAEEGWTDKVKSAFSRLMQGSR
jgi:hypothetical protein